MEPIRGKIGALVVRRLGRCIIIAREADLRARVPCCGERAIGGKEIRGRLTQTPQPDLVRLALSAPGFPGSTTEVGREFFTPNLSKPILTEARSPPHRAHSIDKVSGSVISLLNSVRSVKQIFFRKV
jgi:hypothetical protein